MLDCTGIRNVEKIVVPFLKILWTRSKVQFLLQYAPDFNIDKSSVYILIFLDKKEMDTHLGKMFASKKAGFGAAVASNKCSRKP
jgi:hypothetical protein